MIRPATLEDLSRIETMGPAFFAVSGLDRWFHYNPRCFVKVVTDFMASDQAVVLVGDGPMGAVAMAAALAYPCWFNSEHLSAQELFWWVEPAHRGGELGTLLRRGMEDWAKRKGCLTMEMGAMESLRPEVMANLYERKGYGAKERIFCKRLT